MEDCVEETTAGEGRAGGGPEGAKEGGVSGGGVTVVGIGDSVGIIGSGEETTGAEGAEDALSRWMTPCSSGHGAAKNAGAREGTGAGAGVGGNWNKELGKSAATRGCQRASSCGVYWCCVMWTYRVSKKSFVKGWGGNRSGCEL